MEETLEQSKTIRQISHQWLKSPNHNFRVKNRKNHQNFKSYPNITNPKKKTYDLLSIHYLILFEFDKHKFWWLV